MDLVSGDGIAIDGTAVRGQLRKHGRVNLCPYYFDLLGNRVLTFKKLEAADCGFPLGVISTVTSIDLTSLPGDILFDSADLYECSGGAVNIIYGLRGSSLEKRHLLDTQSCRTTGCCNLFKFYPGKRVCMNDFCVGSF